MKILSLVFVCALAFAKHEEYHGWKSYYIKARNQEDLKIFSSIAESLEVDILSHPAVQREGVVLVKPEHIDQFQNGLKERGIQYRIHFDNVKGALDKDDMLIEARRIETRASSGAGQMSYDNYQELDVIYKFLDDIAATYPQIATLVTPARSFEGRPINYLKISTTNFEDESKPVIFIDGGIHAREWISPPTVTYAVKMLVENGNELLERFDWILLPVVNPDGYAFSFSDNRMWRKTRSTDQHTLSSSCPGVDGNRNYDFFWNTVGVSPSPCADTFAGSAPFSEIETRVVRDVIQEYLPRMALYLTMHSYGSMILYPWGHDGSLPPNAFALHSVGVAMAEKIDSLSIDYFPRYLVGNPVSVLGYAASGAAEDYAHSQGVPLAFTIELPGLDTSSEGFHLNPKYIEQVCKETWEGIVVGAQMAGDLFEAEN